MNGLTPELDRLGDALERAAERDVTGARTQRRRRSRRLALAGTNPSCTAVVQDVEAPSPGVG